MPARLVSRAREHFRSGRRDQHVIFQPGAAESFDICARFDREHHPRLEEELGLARHRAADPRLLVHLEPQTVPGRMTKRLAQPVPTSTSRAAASTALARIPGRTVEIAARCASATALASRRHSGAAVPSSTVRVKSTQYPS